MWHLWESRQSHARFWWGNFKVRNHLEVLSVAGNIILKYIVKGVDRILLAKYWDKWWPLVNTTMTLRGP
jgi:hypothetical protein